VHLPTHDIDSCLRGDALHAMRTMIPAMRRPEATGVVPATVFLVAIIFLQLFFSGDKDKASPFFSFLPQHAMQCWPLRRQQHTAVNETPASTSAGAHICQ
jgi:hypothetical protein